MEITTGSMETALMSDLTAKLPGDVLVDIISRVPYKSTRCCKCVSTRWRDLIAHPDHREKLPRSTLAGFFYRTFDMDRCQYDSHGYRSLSGNWCPIDASLSFLPNYKKIDLLDCCKGLLLCRCSKPYPETPDYVVGNPATEKWVTVPAKEWSSDSYARLGFDPAVSSHFHVFELVPAAALNANLKFDYNIKEVGIYSSKAGGQLYVAYYGAAEASIWVLEDSSSEDYWTLKHNVSYLQLFGSRSKGRYGVISVHPEDDVIFITVESKSTLSGDRLQLKLFSYEIDSKELKFICDLGRISRRPYLSYVPLFSESLADEH
uniref:Uncharacterized protein n=1 Tax=Aegilops tauschii TaxID=37682 RepID=M8BHH1_AEGTA